MPRTTKYQHLDKQTIVAEYQTGTPIKKICEDHQIPTHKLYSILAESETTVRNKNDLSSRAEEFTQDWQHMPITDMANKYDVTTPTLRAFAQKLGLTRPKELQFKRSSLSPAQQQQVADLFNAATPIDEIAAQLGVPRATVTYCIYKKLNIKLSPEEAKRRREAGVLKKHGVTNQFARADVREKVKQTVKEKYGVDHPMKVPAVREKVTTTCIERYGVANPLQSPKVYAKLVKTCMEKYGVPTSLLSPEVKSKFTKTCMEKYGAAYPMQNPDVKAKVANTCMEKYGVENPFQSPEVKAKTVTTCMEKYGTPHPPKVFGKAEQEVRGWLEEVTGLSFPSDRTVLEGKEIDMYNAELRLGIEYCGLFWHTEDSPQPRDKNYHKQKMDGCRAAGVRLVTIYEDEWVNRQPQVKNFLKSILHKHERKVHGRKCAVRDIDKRTAREFLEAHHIQGAPALGLHFAGLYLGDELLGVMSFGRHHRKSNELVLDRLCFKDGVSVAGGSSKLFKHLLRNTQASNVLSWSDNRWSCGAVYRALGFQEVRQLPPDYSYVNFDTLVRVSKQSQKKSTVKCPEGMTELQFANSRNLHRIWDCGKTAWLWTAQGD